MPCRKDVVVNEPCPEKTALSTQIADAVQRSFTARAQYNAALKARHDTAAIEAELAAARTDEKVALVALHAHRQDHGC